MAKQQIQVDDLMQTGYCYVLTESSGENFHPDFQPELTPKEMLELGVFGGKYMTDCSKEFPSDWYENAQLCSERYDSDLNFFGINASQPLSEWQRKGWIYEEDPRGWFQWYCRYYIGRRCPDDDRQIKRWRAMRRHIAQIKKNCRKGDLKCRRNSGRRCYTGPTIQGRFRDLATNGPAEQLRNNGPHHTDCLHSRLRRPPR